MDIKQMLFGFWCLSMVGGSVMSSYYAWSPFADGNGRGAPGFYGPTHK
ncbi:MAG: hypothetical protein RL367_1348 [Pseudomonadota bacterium]|jgi:hypothetical protein